VLDRLLPNLLIFTLILAVSVRVLWFLCPFPPLVLCSTVDKSGFGSAVRSVIGTTER
jgi:hypothetical protein